MADETTYTAFLDASLVASGPLEQVLPPLKQRFDADSGAPFLIFDDTTGQQVDFDLRGSQADVLARALPAKAPAGPGRPRLGVVAREISLLPRHWEWLEQQPNGASAAIRRLVDEARKNEPEEQRARARIGALGHILTAVAGDLPGYEEASRALYARDGQRFRELTDGWPEGIRCYIERRLSLGLF